MKRVQTVEPFRLLGPALMVMSAATIFAAERRKPLRRQSQAEPARVLRNLLMGVLSMAVVAAVEEPVVRRLSDRAVRGRGLDQAVRGRGLVQRLPWPAWARDAVAVLAMDYSVYLWHILTHRVPALWRLHLVHHVDLDMDSATALRFHAADMLVSIPYRAAQVALIGASPRAVKIWQALFFGSVLFHHSNWRLPRGLDRTLSRVLTTPRMHGIHHTARLTLSSVNWSSGLSIWDHLHGTYRYEVPGEVEPIGVPAYRDPREIRLLPSLRLPFAHQRDAWSGADG